MFSYRSLLTESWKITWKNKYLWFLGLFASLVGGSGAWGYQILSQNMNQGLINGSYYKLTTVLAITNLARNFFFGLGNLLHNNFLVLLNVLSVLLVVIIILIVLIWLAITTQAGLINDVKKILRNKKKDSYLSVRQSLIAGNKHFWSVLSLNLAIKVLSATIFFIVSLPLLLLVIENTTILAISYTILFVIFVPVSISLSLMINYAIAYRVLDNYSFVKSFEQGVILFINNWLVSLETGIILFIIDFLASAVILVFLGVFLVPLFLLGIILSLNWLIFLVIFFAFLIVVACGAVLTAFQITTWTNLFLQLKNPGVVAKLERIFKR